MLHLKNATLCTVVEKGGLEAMVLPYSVNTVLNTLTNFTIQMDNVAELHNTQVPYIQLFLSYETIHCKFFLRDSWICFDQTFQGTGTG